MTTGLGKAVRTLIQLLIMKETYASGWDDEAAAPSVTEAATGSLDTISASLCKISAGATAEGSTRGRSAVSFAGVKLG